MYKTNLKFPCFHCQMGNWTRPKITIGITLFCTHKRFHIFFTTESYKSKVTHHVITLFLSLMMNDDFCCSLLWVLRTLSAFILLLLNETELFDFQLFFVCLILLWDFGVLPSWKLVNFDFFSKFLSERLLFCIFLSLLNAF